MDALKSTFGELLDSKKFMASLAGMISVILVTLAGHFHLGLDPSVSDTLATKMLGFVAIYVGAQGVADHGKERAKIEVIDPAQERSP